MLKILKREIIVFNLIGFCLLSLFLYHVCLSLFHGHSSFSSLKFFEFSQEHSTMLLLAGLVVFAIYTGRKFSIVLLMLFTSVIFVKFVSLYIQSSDKFLLLISLFYIFFAYFFCQLWLIELKDPIYSPGIVRGQIPNYNVHNLGVTVRDSLGREAKGWISNLGPRSCFIVIDKTMNLNGMVSLEVDWLGKKFQCVGKVMSTYENGYGIRTHEEMVPQAYLHWSDLFFIAGQRGLILPS